MSNFDAYFSIIYDTRQQGKVQHQLLDVLFIIVAAGISGCNEWDQIALFGLARESWLRQYIELPNGVPSVHTLRRVLGFIDPSQFEKCFCRWTRELVRHSKGDIVSIDGKTVRGAYKDDQRRSPIHLVSAWSEANGLVLGQVKTNEKSNEITAIPELLDLLMIKGCIVTIDAMGTQKEIAKKIVKDKKADYVLALKGNQGNIHDAVRGYFEDALKEKFAGVDHESYKTVEKGHGRIEKRNYYLLTDLGWLPERKAWYGLAGVGMVVGRAEMHPVSSGPLFGMLHIERTIGKSRLVQEIILRRNATRLDFHTTVEWAETHKLLKVGFQMDIHASEALHEIQFGHIARPNHFSRQFDADRFEVSHHKWAALAEGNRGAALLNDCKYGISVNGQEMNLTLLKSSIAPDPVADRGTHGFTYSLYVWNGSFEESHLIREAYSLNHPLTVRISDRFHPPDSSALSTAYGEGGIRKNAHGMKFLEISEPNVVVEAVKLSDDGQNDLVIRLYESMKMHTRCSMKLAFAVESTGETDMLENPLASMPHVSTERAAEITLDFRAFEVKTIRVKLKLNPEV
jgi:predicted transposase YbfD/YdcC